jgi:RimJ/RimL family protein N-acetyltransferase
VIAARHPKGLLADGAVCWRPWDERDLPLVEEASRDDYVALIEHLPVPFDPVAGHDWIRRQENHRVDQRGWSFAIVETEREEAVGGIGITFRHPPGVAEPGCWVIARKRNQGFAEHATTLLCRWALMSDTGIARVQATVEPWNAASQRVVRETRQRVAEWWNCDNAEVGEWFPRRSGGPAFAHPRVGGMRTLSFADPGGYTWGIAQDLPSASGS